VLEEEINIEQLPTQTKLKKMAEMISTIQAAKPFLAL